MNNKYAFKISLKLIIIIGSKLQFDQNSFKQMESKINCIFWLWQMSLVIGAYLSCNMTLPIFKKYNVIDNEFVCEILLKLIWENLIKIQSQGLIQTNWFLSLEFACDNVDP